MSSNAIAVTEDDILSSAASFAISSVWCPVLLYRNTYFVGMGTLYRNKSQREIIVTAGHLFQKDGQAYLWSFRRLHPLADCREAIANAAFIPGADALDVACCVPGKQALIAGFCPSHMGVFETADFRCTALPKPFEVRSLVSGEGVMCGGVVQNASASYIVIPWNSSLGDSGTGFVSNDDRLFVLKGSVDLMPQDCGAIGVPVGTERASFLLGIGRA